MLYLALVRDLRALVLHGPSEPFACTVAPGPSQTKENSAPRAAPPETCRVVCGYYPRGLATVGITAAGVDLRLAPCAACAGKCRMEVEGLVTLPPIWIRTTKDRAITYLPSSENATIRPVCGSINSPQDLNPAIPCSLPFLSYSNPRRQLS